MKLESEPVFRHSTLAQKPLSKTFEYYSDVLDSDGLKLENENNLSSDLKGNEKGAYQFPHTKKDADNDLLSTDDFIIDHDNDVGHLVSFTHSSEFESFEKDPEFYMEKNQEFQLPEIIVCYKENTCNIVKDICVDEGVQNTHANLALEDEPNEEFKKEVMNTYNLEPNCLKLSVESCSEKDSPDRSKPKDLTETGSIELDTTDFILDDIVKLLMRESDLAERSLSESSCYEVEQHSVQISVENGNCTARASVFSPEKCNSSINKSILAYSAPISTPEEPKDSAPLNNISSNTDLQSELVTFDFNSPPPASSSGTTNHEITSSDQDECGENCEFNTSSPTTSGDGAEHDQRVNSSTCVEIENLSKLEDCICDNHSVSNQAQNSNGESGFSTLRSLASLLNYSGPTAYSGSVSLRSDSSTTSTRSFVFPVLQSEWNSSPVRMAKADRRYLRKHRQWRHGLFCCRF